MIKPSTCLSCRLLFISLATALAMPSASCSREEKQSSAAEKKTSASGRSNPGSEVEAIVIGHLGVKLALPKGGRVLRDASKKGWAAIRVGKCVVELQLLEGPADSTFAFEVALATKGQAVKKSKSGKETTHMGAKATKWIHKKKLTDGFLLEFEGKFEFGGKTHAVVVRRRIGKRHLRCSQYFTSRDHRCVKSVCLSLQPAP